MSTHKQIPVILNVDITETIDTFLIEADISEFRAESINVSSSQDSIVIEIETRQEPTESYYLGELDSEYYRRVVPLGFAVSHEDFRTQYSTGTLSIHVDKPRTKKRASRTRPSAVA